MATAVPTTSYPKVADLLARFAGYPMERVRMTPHPGSATEADVLAAERDDGVVCELIDGVLVEKTMGLRESFVARRLAQRLGTFVDAHDLGEISLPDGTVRLFPGRVRAPDVAFFSRAALPKGAEPAEPIPDLVPDLAAEVLSPSNSRGEMADKLKDYFFAGVKLVWYVDPRARTVDVFTAPDAAVTLTAADTLTGGAVLPGFAVPVAELFG